MGTRQEVGIAVLVILIAVAGILDTFSPAATMSEVVPICDDMVEVIGNVDRPGLHCKVSRRDNLHGTNFLPTGCTLQPILMPGMVIQIDHDTTRKCVLTIGTMSGIHRLVLGLPIEVNSAAEDDLEVLPGIGPTLARRIVEHRTVRGSYNTLDELVEVRGIGHRTVERLRAFLFIDKLAVNR